MSSVLVQLPFGLNIAPGVPPRSATSGCAACAAKSPARAAGAAMSASSGGPVIGGALRAAAVGLLASGSLLSPFAQPAFAENELAALAGGQFKSELVDTQCFATSCKLQTEACVGNADCTKGLACTAKCMGDAECTVGCFAKYGNKQLDEMLACTIEDKGCLKIAIMEPGPDKPSEAPKPPKALVAATPATMSGKWYKVMGWNPKYDCFDCQRNSFAKAGKTSASEVGAEIGANGMAVEVEYTMPRVRAGSAPETVKETLHETLQFDTDSKGQALAGSQRTAHTEGKMFGLTFWENWYLIGQNDNAEKDFRFVYYTGKTLQNRYEGAFVYARQPEIPKDALPHIYSIAREAGMEPTGMCCIDNKCFADPASAEKAPTAPLFTPVAVAETPLEAAAAPQKRLPGPLGGLQSAITDLQEYTEDPRPFARELFAKQKTMAQIKEFDADGFRVATK